MNDHNAARGIGWVSIGVGLALVAAPTLMTKGFGMGERPNLGRFLGVRDSSSAPASSAARASRPGSGPGPSPTPETPLSS